MKFLADECLYFKTTKLLRSHGHDVLTIQEAGYYGIKDDKVIELANKEKRILITRDMHFCNILKFHPKDHGGIIALKIIPVSTLDVHENLLNFIIKYTTENIRHSLVIIDRNKFRIRK